MVDKSDPSERFNALPFTNSADSAQAGATAKFHDLVYRPANSGMDESGDAGAGGRFHHHHRDERDRHGDRDEEREEHHGHHGGGHHGHHGNHRYDVARQSDQTMADGSSPLVSLEDQLRANGNLNPETMLALGVLQRAVAPQDLTGYRSDTQGVNVSTASDQGLYGSSLSYNDYGAPRGSAVNPDGSMQTTMPDGTTVNSTPINRADAGGQTTLAPQADAGVQTGVQPQLDNSGAQVSSAPTDANSARTQALSAQDVQSLTALWAATNGMNPSDASTFQKVAASTDGSSYKVGPYQLDGKNIAQWVGSISGANGQIDQAIVGKLVQSGEISSTTAQALMSPEFGQFAANLQAGKVPTADEVAKNLSPELQTAIAGEMVNALAGTQQSGQLDPGMLMAALKFGRPLTQTDLSNQTVAAFVSSIDQQLSQPNAGATDASGKPITAAGATDASGNPLTSVGATDASGNPITGTSTTDTSGVSGNTVAGSDSRTPSYTLPPMTTDNSAPPAPAPTDVAGSTIGVPGPSTPGIDSTVQPTG